MTSVDTQQGDAGVWVTIAELARRKGISKQAASKRVDRLEKDGHLSTRRNGRNREVELATYDHVVGQVGDAFKEQAAETGRDIRGEQQQPQQSGLRDAQTDRARYDAQLKALELAERQGLVVPLRGEHGLETGLVKVTEALIRDLGAPLNWVSEIMQAAAQGEGALRRLLRNKVRDQRATMAQNLAKLAGEAAEAEKSGIQVDFMFGEEP